MKQILLLSIISLAFLSSGFGQSSVNEKVMTKEDFKMLSGREREIMRTWCKKYKVVYPIYLDTTMTNQAKWDVYNYSVQTIARIDSSQNDLYRKQTGNSKLPYPTFTPRFP